MAPSTNIISFLFLLTLFFSTQINARESQFFSKVTPINNNVKETELPNKEERLAKQENNPTFIPETQNGAYGLYGQESNQLTPSTTTPSNYAPYTTPTTYLPYKTPSEEEEEDINKYSNNNNKEAFNANYNGMTNTRLSGTSYASNNNNNYYYKDAYEANKNGLGNTRFTEKGHNTLANQNNNNNNYYYNKAARNYNGERQGMSDTRYMQGGKYHHDIYAEKYNPNQYGSYKSEVDSRNWYNNNNNNNNKGYYGNNENSFEGYQQNREEFQENQEVFDP
ncbi:protein E6-like [Quillaja saponaria]|uniref:Protein E6-like n=1 Tax=Quillaja saponaria TaxID=32244 RepID=A0AAD7KXZ8_QUISA|nr:protein E6-like [Quillaja saponaria]